MPNWCFTNYALTGERKEIKNLYEKMKRLQERKTPLVPNGFGTSWLGCIIKCLGADPNTVWCRGDWSDLRLSEDGDVLYFNTETAWGRASEVEDLIRKKFPSIGIYYLEEELGMGIFQTNDATGKWFSDTIIMDDETDGIEYFTEKEALERISKLKGAEVSTWAEAEEFIDKYNLAQEAAETDRRIWLHRAAICED